MPFFLKYDSQNKQFLIFIINNYNVASFCSRYGNSIIFDTLSKVVVYLWRYFSIFFQGINTIYFQCNIAPVGCACFCHINHSKDHSENTHMRSSERAPRFGSHRWSILDDPIQNISEITMHLILFLYIRTVRILQKS